MDFGSRSPEVVAHDLREPLPFPDGAFAVVYHSHVLEHLDPEQGARLLGECGRVLEPGGLVRVVVPDLETKAVLYLEKLRAAAAAGTAAARDEHEWMVIEMIDQMVRTRPGGRMLDFMRSGRAEAFVRGRIGDEYGKARVSGTPVSLRPPQGPRARLKARLRALLGISEAEAGEAAFRRLGELHLWMYDRISLASALEAAGFAEARTESAGRSRIPGWSGGFDMLDLEAGAPRKPDSLYMEARKS